MQAVILSVGDELVLGQTVDTNSAYLSAQLARLGIGTLYHQTVADDEAAIVRAIRQAAEAAKLVVITGGLGPTADDLTRQGLAQAIDSPLVMDEVFLRALEAYFSKRSRPMPETNKVQAMRPASASCIPNSAGTAPGLHAILGETVIYVMPGVPREMLVMWEQAIYPAIDRGQPSRNSILTRTVHTFGMGESWLAEKLGPLMDRKRNPKVGTTVSGGIVSVRIRSEFSDPRKCQEELEATTGLVEAALGPFVFGRDGESLQKALIEVLKSSGKTLATAESCTGGMLGKLITDVPGASAAYLGGWITYTNEMKISQLGVSPEVIAKHGAVSKETAQTMAQGVIRKSGADFALAITGIAGPAPESGTHDKPVGTVWIALASQAVLSPGHTNVLTDSMLLNLAGDRETIRDRSAKCAMQMLRFTLMNVPVDNWTWGRRA